MFQMIKLKTSLFSYLLTTTMCQWKTEQPNIPEYYVTVRYSYRTTTVNDNWSEFQR